MIKTLTKQKTSALKNSPSIAKYLNRIICGDNHKVLRKLPENSVDCVVTSPPYWRLRDYEVKGQLGQELSVNDYLEKLINVFSEVCRVLKPCGTA